MPSRAFIPLFAALFLFLLCACDSKSPSAAPASTPLPASPQPAGQRAAQPRVVVLSPALAITLKDLGLAPLIVGRHGYDVVLDKSLPVCGDQAGIDYEALIKANPTHIILQWGARDLPERLTELAARHDWIVVNQEVLTLADIRTSAVEMFDLLVGPDLQRSEDAPPGTRGALQTGHDAPSAKQGEQLIEKMAAAFTKRGKGFESSGRVLLLLSTSPCAAVGPGSFHLQVLEAIGGISAITKGGPYQEMDTEDVANLAPDAIILLRPRGEGTPPHGAWTTEEINTLLGPLAGKEIPAVVHHRVAIIDDPLCLMPGSSMVTFADRLAEILRAWSPE